VKKELFLGLVERMFANLWRKMGWELKMPKGLTMLYWQNGNGG